MSHRISVFANSCLKVPVDPVTKMPKTAFERKHKIDKTRLEQCSIDSASTVCVTPEVNAEKTKDFYRSIPDYNEINHLPPEEFYTTLKLLRDQKNQMLGHAFDHDEIGHTIETYKAYKDKEIKTLPCLSKNMKSQLNSTLGSKYSEEKNDTKTYCNDVTNNVNDITEITGTGIKRETRKTGLNDTTNDYNKIDDADKAILPKSDKPKRNHSACSISWNDQNHEVDEKFDQYFEGRHERERRQRGDDDDFRTRSMPTSPLRNYAGSPLRRRRSITVPKPFKMTERDEDSRTVRELASLRKSLSDDMLHQKRGRQRFRARPVPIESRIPLYEKILEDQAMRRAITKINSEADLRAQMKPFSFTKREEKSPAGFCKRALQGNPKPKKKKRFRARPVPKNLFSNYVYDKLREDDFFRTFNRRIRAEEMLKISSLPGSMATRSRLSTPAAHSDLPVDPSPAPAALSSTSSGRRTRSPAKGRREFITTSPQPFRLSTAERAAKKMEEVTRKIYQESSGANEWKGRAHSSSELPARAPADRPNLAALLRAEAVRSRFDLEAARRLAEHRRRAELRSRDRLLRSSNPAWHLVKNNHEEDIAMRLQTRRDEERLRREEFLHEMELMYGRVQQQPMLFERYYAPRSPSALLDSIQLSPRKNGKRRFKKDKSYHFTTPARSRKVSINDTTEYHAQLLGYLNRIENNDKLYSDSEAAVESLDGAGGNEISAAVEAQNN